MSPVSLVFPLFCAAVAIAYFAAPKPYRKYVLLVGSAVFYALYSYKALYFLAFSALSIYVGGRVSDSLARRAAAEKDEDKATRISKRRLRVYVLVLVANLAILFFLKFFNFGVVNLNLLARFMDAPVRFSTLDILMPLGISFYTFQAISYLVDVHRGKYEACRRFDHVLLYLLYFPQLIQGPINKFDEMIGQLTIGNDFDSKRVAFGLQRMAWGFFKKLVIADRAAFLVSNVYNVDNGYYGLIVFLGALFYCIQIYCDFSGGIDIVCGFSEILGIRMMENFRRPFFAETLTDFWRRWHISLGVWMREYVFYPIIFSKRVGRLGKRLRKAGRSKAAKVIPMAIASVVVFFCVGIWHGAAWKFVVYGLYNGIIISSGIVFQDKLDWITHKVLKVNTKAFSWRLFRILRTLFIVVIGRYFSNADSLTSALRLLKRTFVEFNPWVLADGSIYELGLDQLDMRVLFIALLVLFAVSFAQERGVKVREWLSGQNYWLRVAVMVGLVMFVVIYGVYGPEYDTTTFVYQGF